MKMRDGTRLRAFSRPATCVNHTPVAAWCPVHHSRPSTAMPILPPILDYFFALLKVNFLFYAWSLNVMHVTKLGED